MMIWFEYGLLLRFFTLLPYKWGRFLAKIRGAINYHFKRDWRSFCFGDIGLHERAYEAYKEIYHGRDDKFYRWCLKQRYIYQSIEEFDAKVICLGKRDKIDVVFEGYEEVNEYLKSSNVIFTTAHFGSSIVGASYLEKFGVKILGMSSNVTKDKRVHKSISRFYECKYRAIAGYFNGGDVIDIENNGKKFVKFLKEGGSLIMLVDLPPREGENPIYKEFLGKKRGFANGATKLSQSSGAKLVGYVCFFDGERYVMRFGKVGENPYSFLSNEIKKRAWMWWASDLLKTFEVKI